MNPLNLHEFHKSHGARFTSISGEEAVAGYGDGLAEHSALHQCVGVLDLSFRGRLCVIGSDRVRFLHGQVTNDINGLKTGDGCYAALVTAKGKMESDLYVYALAEELLLDVEPGFADKVLERLEKHIIADDVQVIEVAEQYGLLSVQGPKATIVVDGLKLFKELPATPFGTRKAEGDSFGEVYVANNARNGTSGFDLFVPTAALAAVAEKLAASAESAGGRLCGWQALETARIEAGIPRFGADMDETNLPPECGIGERAVSYTKGCYVGQEVLNRIHTMGHVNRQLRRLRLADDLPALPVKGDKLFSGAKEAGYTTSAVASPLLRSNIALAIVRREFNSPGTELILRTVSGESMARVETNHP